MALLAHVPLLFPSVDTQLAVTAATAAIHIASPSSADSTFRHHVRKSQIGLAKCSR